MNYRVYTDAATKIQEGYSNVAFLVLQGNTYLKTHSEIYKTSNISQAESYAVSLALKYIVDNIDIKEDDDVIVFCDSLYTVKFCRKCLKMYKLENESNSICARPINASWLLGIYDNIPNIKGKLVFFKIEAHKEKKNPHSYVDRLAKSGLVIN